MPTPFPDIKSVARPQPDGKAACPYCGRTWSPHEQRDLATVSMWLPVDGPAYRAVRCELVLHHKGLPGTYRKEWDGCRRVFYLVGRQPCVSLAME